MIAKCRLDGYSLGDVAELGRRAVRIDIVDFGGIDTGVAKCIFHAKLRPCPIVTRRGDVIGISTHAKTDEFGVNPRPSCPRMLEFLETHCAGAVT